MTQRILVCDSDFLVMEDMVDMLRTEGASEVRGFTSLCDFRDALEVERSDLAAVVLSYSPDSKLMQTLIDQILHSETIVVLVDGAAADSVQRAHPEIIVLHKPFVQETISKLVEEITERSRGARPARLPDPL